MMFLEWCGCCDTQHDTSVKVKGKTKIQANKQQNHSGEIKSGIHEKCGIRSQTRGLNPLSYIRISATVPLKCRVVRIKVQN